MQGCTRANEVSTGLSRPVDPLHPLHLGASLLLLNTRRKGTLVLGDSSGQRAVGSVCSD